MAESFSVRAILSAKDSGFSSTLNSASKTLESLGSKLKSGFGMGIFQGMGQQAFSAISNGARELIGEIDASNKAWKTFEGNMQILGKTEDEIKSVKKTLQGYATETIYSASDMASSYAQLAAVGIKSADKLVTGFGGLAAASENPAQAMKTLSQQGVQMAAKPTVAWQDFKLMLEQTPAGIARVAKYMGKTTSQLVTDIQDGKVKTEDFFNAVKEVGNVEFGDLARQYKSVGDAADGLKETLGNKLQPAFEVLSQEGIKSISGIIDKLDEGFDGDKFAEKLTSGLETATEYWTAFKDSFSGVGTELGEAFNAIKDGVETVITSFGGSEDPLESFKSICTDVASAITTVANFFEKHGESIGKALPYVVALVGAYKGFKVVSSIVPGLSSFGSILVKAIPGLNKTSEAQDAVSKSTSTSGKKMLTAAKSYALMGVAVLLIAVGFAILAQSAIALSNAGGLAIGVMAGMVVAVVGLGIGMAALLKSLAPMSKKLMPVATAFLAMGAAVLLISAGFAILAFSSIALANAGGAAIGVMVGMVAAIALLAVGAAVLGTALTAGAAGFIAFGASMLMIGAGFALIGVGALLAATALTTISTVLPVLAASGTASATAIAALGGSLIVFAVGAGLAGAACIILGAGLLLIGTAVLIAGAGMLLLGTGALLAATALNMIVAILPQITANGTAGATAIAILGAGMLAFAVGAAAAGVAALVLAAGLLAVSLSIVAASVSVVVLAASVLVLSAAVLVAAVAMAAAAAGLALLNLALPATIANGAAAAAAMMPLSVALLALGAGALVAGAGLIVLGAGALVATAGVVAFGVAMTVGAAGVLLMAGALKAVDKSMGKIADNASSAEESLLNMQEAVSIVEAGLKAIGDMAESAMDALVDAFDGAEADAKSSGENLADNFKDGLESGLNTAPTVATTAVNQVNMTLSMGRVGAYQAGAFISLGFAQGMQSQLGAIRAAAASMAAAADAAVRAKAKIHSPSRVADKLGSYWGEGYVNGLESMVSKAWRIAEELVAIPHIASPVLAGGYSGELYSDYEYSSNTEFRVEVPLNIDGREFAKAEAEYMRDELDRKDMRESRKLGRV